MKKIISIVAAVMLIAALSVNVFAAETGTLNVTVTEADNWWHEVKFSEMFDFATAEGYDTLTVTVEGVNLIPAYNSPDGWVQAEEPVNGTATIDLANCILDENGKVALSVAAGEYVLTWTLSKAGEEVEAPAAEPEADAAPEAESTESSETESTAPAAEADEAASPETGLTLAVLPAVAAIAAVIVSKKR